MLVKKIEKKLYGTYGVNNLFTTILCNKILYLLEDGFVAYSTHIKYVTERLSVVGFLNHFLACNMLLFRGQF